MGYNTIDAEEVAGVARLPELMDIIGNEHLSLYATELHVGTLGIVPYDFGLGTDRDFFFFDFESVHANANDVHVRPFF